jgi:hypothetical protein
MRQQQQPQGDSTGAGAGEYAGSNATNAADAAGAAGGGGGGFDTVGTADSEVLSEVARLRAKRRAATAAAAAAAAPNGAADAGADAGAREKRARLPAVAAADAADAPAWLTQLPRPDP